MPRKKAIAKKTTTKKYPKTPAFKLEEKTTYDLSEFPADEVARVERELLADNDWLNDWVTGDPFVYEQFLKQVYEHCKTAASNGR